MNATLLFIHRIFLYLGLLLLLLLMIFGLVDRYTARHSYSNAETEANLWIMGDSLEYDIVMLGISHARIFSRHRNHERFEALTGAHMINLSQGGGYGGLENQHLFLNYFLERGNRATTAWIVLSPMLMYNRAMDLTRVAFEREPFELPFFSYVAQHGSGNRFNQLTYYLRSKLFWNWITIKPTSLDRMDKHIDGLDSAAMARTIPYAYPKGLEEQELDNRMAVLEGLFNTLSTHDMDIVIILPAALFGKWPGHDRILDRLRPLQATYGFELYDFAERYTMQTQYFYDHHHLNTDGIERFLQDLKNLPGE
jgi:hypothetical protein